MCGRHVVCGVHSSHACSNADFHPLMYLRGLAEAAVRRGVAIYEGTKAWKAGGCVGG